MTCCEEHAWQDLQASKKHRWCQVELTEKTAGSSVLMTSERVDDDE